MITDLHSFWFIFGLSAGIITTCILWVVFSFVDWMKAEKRYRRAVRKAHDKGYFDGRKFKDKQLEYFEKVTDELWYEVEEIQKKLEAQREQIGAS